MIPGSVKKLIELSRRAREVEQRRSEMGKGKETCQACRNEKEGEKLSKCKGCESVWYCDKVSLNVNFILSKLTVHRVVKLWAGMRKATRASAESTGQ